MTEVAQFYVLSHIFIAFIGGVLLLTIWYNIRNRFKTLLEENDAQKRVDKGLLYLSMAMFVWVFSGIWYYAGNTLNITQGIGFQLGVNLFSTLNNLFLLLALFYFYYAPSFIYNNKKNTVKIIYLIVLTAILTVIISQSLGTINIYNGILLSAIPDLLVSTFLSGLLMLSFYRTFAKRDMPVIAILSVLIMVLVWGSQLPEVFLGLQDDFVNHLIKIIAKTSLISLFLVLAATWVIRLASMPKPNEMALHFIDWSVVKIHIPSNGIHNEIVDFKSKTTQYKNLLKFAVRRKFAAANEQSIGVGGNGELKNQTYLSRIIENINDILSLTGDKKLERRDLFTFIGEGRYRLRMIPEHITIDEALLEEFLKSVDNQEYSRFCD